jgi:hypothetical protein
VASVRGGTSGEFNICFSWVLGSRIDSTRKKEIWKPL